MAIKRVMVRNFRSFRELAVDLANFNVIIGSNASGKSNFIRIFEFLRDIQRYGLDNAVSIQGGVEYLRNVVIGRGEELSIEVEADVRREEMYVFGLGRHEDELLAVRPRNVTYGLSLAFRKRGLGYDVSKEMLNQLVDFVKLGPKEPKSLDELESVGKGTIVVTNTRGNISVDVRVDSTVPIDKDQLKSRYIIPRKLPPNAVYLGTRSYMVPEVFRDIAIYDFDPKLPKRAVQVSGKVDLEENGSNLSLVLDRIVGEKESRRKFSNLIKDLLPYVVDVDVTKLTDKSMLFRMKETYSGPSYIPGSAVSDGTINVAALVIALYFQRDSLTIIEEPERDIHPHLVAKISGMMKDAARNKQILVTTHNPEFVRHSPLDSLLLVFRDQSGFTQVMKPAQQASLKTFLSDEMGIADLYVQNLLGPDT